MEEGKEIDCLGRITLDTDNAMHAQPALSAQTALPPLENDGPGPISTLIPRNSGFVIFCSTLPGIDLGCTFFV